MSSLIHTVLYITAKSITYTTKFTKGSIIHLHKQYMQTFQSYAAKTRTEPKQNHTLLVMGVNEVIYLVSEADMIPPIHLTDPSRFQQTLMIKPVWDSKIMTVSVQKYQLN